MVGQSVNLTMFLKYIIRGWAEIPMRRRYLRIIQRHSLSWNPKVIKSQSNCFSVSTSIIGHNWRKKKQSVQSAMQLPSRKNLRRWTWSNSTTWQSATDLNTWPWHRPCASAILSTGERGTSGWKTYRIQPHHPQEWRSGRLKNQCFGNTAGFGIQRESIICRRNVDPSVVSTFSWPGKYALMWYPILVPQFLYDTNLRSKSSSVLCARRRIPSHHEAHLVILET